MFLIRLRHASSALGLLALAGTFACGHGHGSGGTVVIEAPPLELVLADPILGRDPVLVPSSDFEEAVLDDYDEDLELIAVDAGLHFTYEPWIDLARSQVGIDPRYRIWVAQDFRLSGFLDPYGGGAAGHEVVVLDGKLLDALLEISTFLALWERGDVVRDPIEAFDEIVFLHNEVVGETSGGFIYRYWDVDLDAALGADRNFLRYLGALIDREFSHMFLGHALSSLRREGRIELVWRPDAIDEEEADLSAGMLVAKARGDLFQAQELLDLQNFQLEQRFDRDLTYWDVLSTSFQSQPLPDSSPLVLRKGWVAEGFDRYRWYNF